MNEISEILIKELKLLYEIRNLKHTNTFNDELEKEITSIEASFKYCLGIHQAEREVEKEYQASIQQEMLERELTKSKDKTVDNNKEDLFNPDNFDLFQAVPESDIEIARSNKHPDNNKKEM